MSNAYAAPRANVKSSENYGKRVSLLERFKKYLLENNEIICAGIIAMNGGIYIPRKYEK